MKSQIRLIDGVRSFSPTREKWVDKPPDDLPKKLTVHFKTGQTGYLDLKDPLSAHRARRIDRQARTGKPVYVEIDHESNVITNVRIPQVYKVERLNSDDYGNLQVRLHPSSTIHLLLKSDPDFESMRDSLQVALADGTERLITDTRDNHEIIDVRKPEENPGVSPGPEPPALPDDPPVSEARAGELFTKMKNRSCSPCDPNIDLPGAECISFLYPDNGCWIRAHIMCRLMMEGGPDTTTNPPEDPAKIWIDFGANCPINVPTPNHPDCHVPWCWHVAPTLQVIQPGGNETWVIDPSVSPASEFKNDWRNRQDPSASLQEGPWTDWSSYGDGNGSGKDLADANSAMQYFRGELLDRCLDFGPPPYSCTRRSFFIIDRNTFSDDEIEAMLQVSSPALVESAFYIVLDGFSPDDLGFTSASMEITPSLSISPAISGMTITPIRLEFEYPTHLNRRQRLTWVYDISFTDTSAFTSERIPVKLDATVSSESCSGFLYLIQQPNPYEIDGETSWLSTDLRVFQIDEGQSKFGVTMGSDPSAFITQVITNLNTGNTGGQTFDDDISVNQQTTRLELSQTVDGTPVYNFAVAKVRYRALSVSATDVRVFFRLFPVATTSLEYDQATTYRRYETGGTIIPLLGIKNNEVAAIPCFASPRIDSAAAGMTTQTDPPNVLTMPPNPTGAEVVRYFGCWLDFNQTQPQFPIQPSPVDGPWTTGRSNIQDLIRNEHQCLVSEIAFTPAPVQNGSTPSLSDKLAQRNLSIVESANPGLVLSRRIPQTFEIRPAISRPENDELMIDWGNVPAGSVATLYLPRIDTNDILLLAARKYRSHRLTRIDEHTLRFDTGGITYLPIPFTDDNYPGLLTVDLPEGIEKGQVFTIMVRQVTDGELLITKTHRIKAPQPGWRRIVGSFQLTIPVREKADILPNQQRLLSNLRWIERAIPANNRWSPVFGKYVTQIAHRVDALGGDSNKVAPSATGQWREAYRRCLLLTLAAVLLIAMLMVGIGVLPGGLAAITATPLFALLIGVAYLWTKRCRPTICQKLRTLLAGTGLGAIILALLVLFGISTPQLITMFIVSAGLTASTAIVSWVKGCFK